MCIRDSAIEQIEAALGGLTDGAFVSRDPLIERRLAGDDGALKGGDGTRDSLVADGFTGVGPGEEGLVPVSYTHLRCICLRNRVVQVVPQELPLIGDAVIDAENVVAHDDRLAGRSEIVAIGQVGRRQDPGGCLLYTSRCV